MKQSQCQAFLAFLFKSFSFAFSSCFCFSSAVSSFLSFFCFFDFLLGFLVPLLFFFLLLSFLPFLPVSAYQAANVVNTKVIHELCTHTYHTPKLLNMSIEPVTSCGDPPMSHPNLCLHPNSCTTCQFPPLCLPAIIDQGEKLHHLLPASMHACALHMLGLGICTTKNTSFMEWYWNKLAFIAKCSKCQEPYSQVTPGVGGSLCASTPRQEVSFGEFESPGPLQSVGSFQQRLTTYGLPLIGKCVFPSHWPRIEIWSNPLQHMTPMHHRGRSSRICLS